jgi:hypothetical protein
MPATSDDALCAQRVRPTVHSGPVSENSVTGRASTGESIIAVTDRGNWFIPPSRWAGNGSGPDSSDPVHSLSGRIVAVAHRAYEDGDKLVPVQVGRFRSSRFSADIADIADTTDISYMTGIADMAAVTDMTDITDVLT